MIPPLSRPLEETGEENSDVAGSSSEDPTKIVDGPKVVNKRVEPPMTTVGTRDDYYWDEKYGTWVYNLGTTTAPLGVNSDTTNEDKSTVSTVDAPPLGLNAEPRNADERKVSTVDAPKVMVEKVEPAKGPTSTTAPPLGVNSDTTNEDKSTVSTVDPPSLGLNSEPRNVDESKVSTVDGPKVMVAQVKPAKIATSTTAPPLGVVDETAVDPPKGLVDNDKERQRLALASFFNTPKKVKATSKPRNRKHKQNEGKSASKLSLKKKYEA